MCIHILKSSDNNQTHYCTLIHVADGRQRFSASIQMQAKDCHGFELMFTRITSPGSRVCRILISVMTNATPNHFIHIRITYRKDCLITHHVSSHKPQPKNHCPCNKPYKYRCLFEVVVNAVVIEWHFHMSRSCYNDSMLDESNLVSWQLYMVVFDDLEHQQPLNKLNHM